jgi:hypothetical protein
MYRSESVVRPFRGCEFDPTALAARCRQYSSTHNAMLDYTLNEQAHARLRRDRRVGRGHGQAKLKTTRCLACSTTLRCLASVTPEVRDASTQCLLHL